jgi:hypothetical protein
MTPHHQSLSTQSRIPAVSRTNGLCVFEQPFLFLDACQALELGVKRVISQHEKFLSVKFLLERKSRYFTRKVCK